MPGKDFSEKYSILLKKYFSNPDEKYLLEISKLGQELARANQPVEDLATFHEKAVQVLGREFPKAKLTDVSQPISVPLMNLLRAYGEESRLERESCEKAKKSLQQKQDLLTAIIEGTQDFIFAKDVEGRHLLANGSYARAIGYPAKDIVGKTNADLFPPEDANKFDEEDKQTLFCGSCNIFENEALVNEEKRTFSTTKTSFCDPRGKVLGLVGIARDMTEQRRAEKALRDSHTLFESLVNHLPQNISRKDLEGRIVYINDSHAKILGSPPGEIIGKTDFDFNPRELAEKYSADDRRVIETGQELDTVESHISKEGEERLVRVIKSPVRDSLGKIIGIQVIFWDVTEQKLAEDALRESEEKFKTLVESVNVIPWSFDLKKDKFTFIGKQVKSILGCPVESWTDLESWKNHIHPQDRDKSMEFCMASTERGEDHDFEYRFINADGKIVWVHDVITVRKDEKGEPFELIGFMLDITKQKLAEEKLQKSQRRLSQVLDATTEGIWDWNIQTGEVYFSPHWLESLGYSPEEVHPHVGFWESIAHPDDLLRLKKASQDHLDGKTATFSSEIRLRRKSGEYRWYLDRGKVVEWNEAGEPLRMVGSDSDITERKHSEEALKASETNLRTIIASEPECVKTITKDGILLDMNPAGLAMIEADSIEQVRGKNVYDLVLPEHRQAFTALNKRVFKGESGELEFQIEGLKGTRLWVDAYATPLYDEKGKVKTNLSLTRNVTESKQAEEELRQIHDQLQISIKNMPNAYILWNRDLKVVEWNKAAEEIFGYSKEEMLGKNPVDFIVPKPVRHLVEEVIRKLEIGEVVNYSEKDNNIRKDGKLISCQWFNTPLADKDGNIFGILTLAQDVTDRKQAEESLQKSEERFRSLVEQIPDGVYRSTPEGRFVDVNPAMVELFGYGSKGALMEVDIKKELYFDDKERDEVNELLMETGQENFQVFRMRHKKGHEIWVEDHGNLVHDADGNVLYHEGVLRDISDRKRAEEKLKASEARFRSLYQNTPVMLHSIDGEGRLIGVSDYWLKKMGYARSEVLGKKSSDFLTEKSRLEIGKTMSDFFEKGVVKDVPYQFVKKNGEIMDVELSAIVERKEDGAVIRSLGVMIDVTERKKIEQKLLESEEQFRAMCATANDGIMMMDAAGKVTYCNEAARMMFGYPANQMLGKALHNLVVPERYRQVFEKQFKIFKKTGKGPAIGKRVELSALRREGTEFPIELSLSGVKIKGEWHSIGFVQDISLRKKNEEELETMSYALEQSANGVLITDTQGNIEYVNPTFTQTTGYTAEEVMGKNPRFLKSGKTPLEEYKKLWTSIKAGGKWHGEFHNRKKDGTLYWESASISAVKDKAGQISHFLAIKEDITERKLEEEKRAQLEEQLRQAQKMETMGRLAGGIAHDFNNILQAIHGYVDMCLEEVAVDNQIHEDLTEVMKATNRAKDLVQQILAFSRKDAQERKPVRVHLLVREAIKLLKASLPATVEIHQNINNYCAPVLANQGQIHQVVMNLCTNAAHAMKENGGELKVCLEMVTAEAAFVQAHPKLSANKYLQLTISDQGVGMKREVMDRIFEPFFTTKGVGEGTGLGLSVVHGIIQTHGGDISVESELGKGTTFCVYLPAVEEDAEEPTHLVEAPQNGQGSILFVDDEEMVSSVIARILERSGYKVTTKNNAPDALQTFRTSPRKFDLVITDQMMPQMTGVKFARELLNLRADLPIILLSGFSETATPENAKEMGIREYIKKPVVASDLTKTIARVMGGIQNHKK